MPGSTHHLRTQLSPAECYGILCSFKPDSSQVKTHLS